jgi:hypothetical protein
MATQVVSARGGCTLYQIEDHLEALVNTMALVEEPAAREAILDEIGQAVRGAREKRDAVVGFLRHCADQERFADAEIERIQKRKAFIARVRGELERYLTQIIERFAEPDRRGIRRLEGNFSSMRIQKNPDSVLITDDRALPVAWKDIVITMPAYSWEALFQRLDLEERAVFEREVKKGEFKPDKKSIGCELKKGEQIEGAQLKAGDLRLVIE